MVSWQVEIRSISRGLLDLARHLRERRHHDFRNAAVLLFSGQELEFLKDDLRTRLRRVVPVKPRVESKPSLNVKPVALADVAGDRFGLLAERRHAEPVGLFLPSVRRISEGVRRDREVRDEGAVVRDLGLRLLAEIADE